MKPRNAIIAAALACMSAAPPAASLSAPKGVAELAGRTPGKARRCLGIATGTFFQTSSADPHLLLYNDGKTIWASKLDADCGFETGQSVLPDSSASYYCNGDFVRAAARVTLLPFGRTCVLGNFTPYSMSK